VYLDLEDADMKHARNILSECGEDFIVSYIAKIIVLIFSMQQNIARGSRAFLNQ
jgi:hypothetical protein